MVREDLLRLITAILHVKVTKAFTGSISMKGQVYSGVCICTAMRLRLLSLASAHMYNCCSAHACQPVHLVRLLAIYSD